MSAVNPDWYRTFFHGLALDLWRAAVSPQMTKGEVDFAVAALCLNEKSGARVLDCPCGNGRHAIELASRGFAVRGVDISSEFLGEARATAMARGLAIDFRQGDMSELEADGEFDAAVCLGNSFGYTPHASTLRYLSKVAQALVPGGRFLIDTGMLAETLLPKLEDRLEMEIAGVTMVVDHRYDAANSKMEATYEFRKDGRMERSEMCQYVYTAAELRRMLVAAGFENVAFTSAEFGSSSCKEFELGDSWVRVTAQRA